jgi:SAM-dependent methyltransferase
MSQFSSAWLALREPADHRSVNGWLRAALLRSFAGRHPHKIVDLGSGTGSNCRGLAPSLGERQHWTLVDYDPALLAAARVALDGACAELLPPGFQVRFQQADLAKGDLAPILAGHDLVTASALFDLVSSPVIDRLAEAVAGARQVFYTVLTYDGLAAWLPEHPADSAMRAAFNRHQRGDKGFGPAAGPEATALLAGAFRRHDYHVTTAKSPWVLDASFRPLREEVDQGWAAAVAETSLVPAETIEDWLRHRLSEPDAITIVGHEDLLALPKERA